MKKIFFIFIVLFLQISHATEFTVMHSPGGVSDIVTRFIASELEDKKFIVVNRPGAAGKIALNHLFEDKTIMLATMAQVFATNPLNFKDLGHDPFSDLEVLAVIGVMPSALVCNSKTGISNFENFKNYNKNLSFGIGGYGSSEHISTEIFLSKIKINYTIIPYAQGGITSVKDLIGGHIDCMFANYPTIKPHLKNENLKVLLTSHKLDKSVVTWNDVYKENFPFQSYLSIIAPKTMSNISKEKVVNNFNTLFENLNYNQKILDLGIFPISSTSNQKIKESIDHMKDLQKTILEKKIKISN